jgi:hypothetical protein
VLLLSEVFKLVFSGYMTTSDSKEPSDAQGRGLMKLLWLALNSSKVNYFCCQDVMGIASIVSCRERATYSTVEVTAFAKSLFNIS